MIKKYLVKSAAALVMGFAAAACSHDFSVEEQGAKQAIDNAQSSLGFYIPENQDWVLTKEVTANVVFGGDYGTENTVTIYQNDPTQGLSGIVLGSAKGISGSSASFSFPVAKSTVFLYAAMTDHKGYNYIKTVFVNSNDQLTADFSDKETQTRATTRTATNAWVNIPIGTNPASYAASILEKSVELTNDNNNVNTPGYYWYNNDSDKGIVKNDNYVINYLISGTWNGTVNQLSSVGVRWTGNWTTDEWGNNVPEATSEARTLYVKGKWILPAGESVSCGQGSADGFVDGVIVVDKGGEIEVNGTLNLNNTARLIVLEGGKVTGSGTININNGSKSGEESYNFGEISTKTLNQNYGNFFNYGSITSETLLGGAGGSCFVNYGSVNVIDAAGQSNNGSYLSGNLQIKNNCKFIAQNVIYAKNIENGVGAYIECGELHMSAGTGGLQGVSESSYVALDNNSHLYVKKRTGSRTTSGDYYGNNSSLIGPYTGDYAYVGVDGLIRQWNFTASDSENHAGMIINNLMIYVKGTYSSDDADEFNAWWNLQQVRNEVGQDIEDNRVTLEDSGYGAITAAVASFNWSPKKGNGNVQMLCEEDAWNFAPIEESDCTPAINPGTSVVIEQTYPIWSYAFEDSNLKSDYDLNDVVIKVKRNSQNPDTQIDITLVAAGCEYDNEVYLGTQQITWDGKGEVHDALGVAHRQMINTGKGPTAQPVTTTISIPEGFDFQTADFKIRPLSGDVFTGADGGDGYVHLASTGSQPTGVIIPYDWSWPIERICITDAYNVTGHSFAEWAGTPNIDLRTASADWFEHPVSGKVMK